MKSQGDTPKPGILIKLFQLSDAQTMIHVLVN